MARRSKVNLCGIIGVVMIFIGMIYVIVCTILKMHNQWLYRIIFAVWVMIYMILMDLVEPVVMDRFRRKSEKQVTAYYKYAVLDMIGIAGLLWFVIMSGMLEDLTHYAGIAIFIVCFIPKNVFYKKFNTRLSYSERRQYEETEEDDDIFMIDISDD